MAWVNIMDLVYPVGSIYLSQDSTSPASIFGGTWTAIDGGKVLRANAEWSEIGSDTVNLSHWHESFSGMDYASRNIYFIRPNGDNLCTGVVAASSRPFAALNQTAISWKTSGTDKARFYGTDKQLSTSQSIVQKSQNIYAWYRTA